jgi:hypothetical protein
MWALRVQTGHIHGRAGARCVCAEDWRAVPRRWNTLCLHHGGQTAAPHQTHIAAMKCHVVSGALTLSPKQARGP